MLKAPIYLHKDGNVTEISIEQGIEVVKAAATKGYIIERASGKYGGDITVTADDAQIKFPAHYADALDIAFTARPPDLSWRDDPKSNEQWFWMMNPEGVPIFQKRHDTSWQFLDMLKRDGWHGPYESLGSCTFGIWVWLCD